MGQFQGEVDRLSFSLCIILHVQLLHHLSCHCMSPVAADTVTHSESESVSAVLQIMFRQPSMRPFCHPSCYFSKCSLSTENKQLHRCCLSHGITLWLQVPLFKISLTNLSLAGNEKQASMLCVTEWGPDDSFLLFFCAEILSEAMGLCMWVARCPLIGRITGKWPVERD